MYTVGQEISQKEFFYYSSKIKNRNLLNRLEGIAASTKPDNFISPNLAECWRK